MSSYQETLLSESTVSEPYSQWNILCRTCLQSGASHSIFDLDEKMQVSFADKVMQCVNVSIRESDNLPNQICSQCIEDLNVAYRFRQNCLEAIELLEGSVTSGCLEEKPTELSPIITELVPEDEDQIAIHLTTGAMYTYKPTAGYENSAAIVETVADTGEEIVEFDPPANLMTDQLANSSDTADDASKDDDEEYLVYLKDEPNAVPAVTKYTELMVPTDLEEQNDDCIIENEDHSIEEEGVKTLQTIRKTNRPNEMKPTIELVTSQPATDGTGMETVIRIKRNLAAPKPSFLCKICNVTYKHKHALDTHMRRHRGDRPYKCEFCEKSFVVPFELQRHVRIHTGQKPYKCRYCDRAYSDFGSKTKHERTHTGERPYVCDFCGKSFSYSHVLSSHRAIHTGVKKYGCTICGKRFAKSHHLKSHYNTHSGQRLIATVQSKKADTVELQADNNNTKEDTTNVVYTELLQDELIASNDDEAHGSSTLLGQQQSDGDDVLVDSYPDTGAGLLATEWPLVVDGDKGEECTSVAPSGVTIVPEELENVSIVNFSDYMIKTECLESFMVEDSVDGDPLVVRQLMER